MWPWLQCYHCRLNCQKESKLRSMCTALHASQWMLRGRLCPAARRVPEQAASQLCAGGPHPGVRPHAGYRRHHGGGAGRHCGSRRQHRSNPRSVRHCCAACAQAAEREVQGCAPLHDRPLLPIGDCARHDCSRSASHQIHLSRNTH